MAVTRAARESVRAVDLLFHATGTGAIYRKHPLERLFRDIHVGAQHASGLTSNFESDGQVLIGLRPSDFGWWPECNVVVPCRDSNPGTRFRNYTAPALACIGPSQRILLRTMPQGLVVLVRRNRIGQSLTVGDQHSWVTPTPNPLPVPPAHRPSAILPPEAGSAGQPPPHSRPLSPAPAPSRLAPPGTLASAKLHPCS